MGWGVGEATERLKKKKRADKIIFTREDGLTQLNSDGVEGLTHSGKPPKTPDTGRCLNSAMGAEKVRNERKRWKKTKRFGVKQLTNKGD